MEIPTLFLAGNEYQANVMPGRYDASYGLSLTGTGNRNFIPKSPVASGLILDGDVKDLKLISIGKRRILLASINDSKLKAFSIK